MPISNSLKNRSLKALTLVKTNGNFSILSLYTGTVHRSPKGAQWLSGRVLDSRPVEPHRRHCVVVLGQDTFIVQPRKTRPWLTERLLMGRKESNQTNRSQIINPTRYRWGMRWWRFVINEFLDWLRVLLWCQMKTSGQLVSTQSHYTIISALTCIRFLTVKFCKYNWYI